SLEEGTFFYDLSVRYFSSLFSQHTSTFIEIISSRISFPLKLYTILELFSIISFDYLEKIAFFKWHRSNSSTQLIGALSEPMDS
ncbi:MAG: hypothetical protein ACFFAM_10280, partial [Promethearchaeota archaeon]